MADRFLCCKADGCRGTFCRREEKRLQQPGNYLSKSGRLPVNTHILWILREVAAKRALPPLFWYNVNRQTNISKKEINAHEHYTLSSSIM